MSVNEFENNEKAKEAKEVEKMLDEAILAFGKEIENEQRRPAIINVVKMQAFVDTYKLIKNFTRGTRAKVEYELHEPYVGMGYVSVSGYEVRITDTDRFVEAIKHASNFGIYSKTDGTTQMDFTFHGLVDHLD